MNSILSKISAPLLVGSILALGALAYPGHADAGEARFIFRLKAATVEPSTVVADNGGEEGGMGGTGTPGGDSGGTGSSSGDGSGDTGTPSGSGDDTAGGGEGAATTWPHMVITLSNGMTLICRSDDGFDREYRKTPEAIATLLPGRTLTMTRATTAAGTMPDYLKTGKPGEMAVEWSFRQDLGTVHAPRSGCNYGAVLPGEVTYSPGWSVSHIATDAALPAVGQTLTITDAHVERIAPFD